MLSLFDRETKRKSILFIVFCSRVDGGAGILGTEKGVAEAVCRQRSDGGGGEGPQGRLKIPSFQNTHK